MRPVDIGPTPEIPSSVIMLLSLQNKARANARARESAQRTARHCQEACSCNAMLRCLLRDAMLLCCYAAMLLCCYCAAPAPVESKERLKVVRNWLEMRPTEPIRDCKYVLLLDKRTDLDLPRCNLSLLFIN